MATPIVPAPYEASKSAKKAGIQVLMSVGAILGTALVAALSSPEVLDYVKAAAKDAPWLPVLFLALRFGATFLRDRARHRGPGGEFVQPEPGPLPPDKVISEAIPGGQRVGDPGP